MPDSVWIVIDVIKIVKQINTGGNKMFKKAAIIALSLVTVFSLSACQSTDVIGKAAPVSFEAVLDKIPDKVKFDEMHNGWALESPKGERFAWSKDFSAEGKADLMIEFDATPFINAGLDVTKLPKDTYIYDETMSALMIHSELGDDKFAYSGEATPMESFKNIVKTHRDILGYHAALDHYGFALGNGNMFEWAKDMSQNDKDIVFVLNPQPFVDAGVDVDKVEGWVFAKVEMMDKAGNKEQVDKFLKPYDLK